jgi:hypothetical protein
MKSKRSVLANRFAGNERDLARARTCGLTMVILCLLAFCALPSSTRAQVPVYEVTPVESTIKFDVESVPIKGTFEKWNASLKFSSTDVRSAVLEIEIQADSVDTGSGMKNNKLKSEDSFNVQGFPPRSRSNPRKSFRPVQTHSTWKATSPFVA